MSHTSHVAHHTACSSIRSKAIPALAALLLCANAWAPASAYAALYDSSLVEDSSTLEGSSSDNQSSDPIVLRSLETSGTALYSIAIETNTVLEVSRVPETFEQSILASSAESFANSTPDSRIALPLVWDFSALDTSSATLQEVTATAVLPDGYLWEDGTSSLTFTKLVSVQEPNKPRLDTHNSTSSALFFPWVVPNSFTERDIDAFFALEGEDFSSLGTNDHGWVQGGGLALYASDLVDGAMYRIRIEYPGGYSEAGFLYSSGNALIVDTTTGDRDGGDGDGNGPAQGEQPLPEGPPPGATAPDQDEDDNSANTEGLEGEGAGDETAGHNPSTPASPADLSKAPGGNQAYADTILPLSAKHSVFERYSSRETTIAGTRLADLCAAGETVSFDQDGVVVSVPSAFLSSLGVQPSDTFSVYALKTAHNSVAIALAVNGQTLLHAPGMSVRMPYEASEKAASINVLDEKEVVVAQGSFVGTSLTFSVDKPGTFRIVESGAGTTDDTLAVALQQNGGETNVAYGANIGDTNRQVKDNAESPLSLALVFCVFGALAAALGYGMLAFVRKRT